MKKLLIAVSSPTLEEELQERLTGLFDMVFCQDGIETVEMLNAFRPDVLVLDFMLSNMDGVAILQATRDAGIRPKVVALTAYISDYLVSLLEPMNIYCMMRFPCNCGQIAARILDVALWEENNQEPDREIRNILGILGFKMNTGSYHITQTAIHLYIKDPTQAVTTQLYPAVAAACNGTVTQVEKAIRSCVESAWKDCNETIWRLYFAVGKNGKVSKPSNAEFLARITGCVIENTAEAERRGEDRKKIV